MSIKVVYYPPYVSCGSCGYMTHVENQPAGVARKVIVYCSNPRCEQYERRAIVHATVLECEEAPA